MRTVDLPTPAIKPSRLYAAALTALLAALLALALGVPTASAQSATLTASNVSYDSATLTISGHTEAWYYKYTTPGEGLCSDVVAAGTSTANVNNLFGGEEFTFWAYDDSGCSTQIAGATATFTTKGISVSNLRVAGDRDKALPSAERAET